MANPTVINEKLKKMDHYDADERYMATSDLIAEMAKQQGQLDSSLQLPIRNAILKQLDDKSSNVATLAVKALAQLVQKFEAKHIEAIVDRLSQKVNESAAASGGLQKQQSAVKMGGDDKGKEGEAKADIITDGLKIIVSSVNDENGKNIAPKLVRSLLVTLSTKKKAATEADIDVEMMCVEVLKDVLTRFGSTVVNEHENILTALVAMLDHTREGPRQQANITLGPLVMVLNNQLFESLMGQVITAIEKSKKPETFIQTVGIISRAAGVRVGAYLPKIIPKLSQFCKLDSKKSADENAKFHDLWENSLHAFDSLIHRCPYQLTQYIPEILKLAVSFLNYDPLVADEEDADMGDSKAGGKAADDEWGGGGDGGWGDGGGDGAAAGGGAWADGGDAVAQQSSDDTSWKVRRAAVGVLDAFIRCRADILKDHASMICEALVKRFKEHDATVKEEILLATRDMLGEVMRNQPKAVSPLSADRNTPPPDDDKAATKPPLLKRQSSLVAALESKWSDIVSHCDSQYKAAAGLPRTRQAIFLLLRELVLVNGNVQEYLPKIMPHVLDGMKATGKHVESVPDALQLLHVILLFHDFDVMKVYLKELVPATIQCVKAGENITVKPEALRVCGALVANVAEQPGQAAVAKDLYAAVHSQLVLADVVTRLKETSIDAMAILLAKFGDVLEGNLKQVLPVLMERLGNEVTSMATLSAFTTIANAKKAKIGAVVNDSLTQCCAFVRKANTQLQHRAISTMEALVRNYAGDAKDKEIAAVIKEVSIHVSDQDLIRTHLVFELYSTIIEVKPQSVADLGDVLTRTYTLLKSPLLSAESVALPSLIKFFQVLQAAKSKQHTYVALQGALLATVDAKMPNPNRAAVAQCIAGMSKKADSKEVASTVEKFIADIKAAGAAEHAKHIALLAIGEIGHSRDLSDFKGVENTVFSAFDSKADAVKVAASFALGNLTVGNMGKFLPALLSLVKANADRRYALLASLKEVIQQHTSSPAQVHAFKAHVAGLIPILSENTDAKDEGVRLQVASCLGGLLVIDAKTVLPKLEELAASKSAYSRAVSATSIRYGLTTLLDAQSLKAKIGTFIALLKDADLEVRRQTILTINALVRAQTRWPHANEVIGRDPLDKIIMPALYAETPSNLKLVVEIDYGGFKQSTDTALPVRRAAFQALETVLELVPHRLDMQAFIKAVAHGLTANYGDGSHYDLQNSTWQLFAKQLATRHASSLCEWLDSCPEFVMDTVKGHMKTARITVDAKTQIDPGRDPVQSTEALRTFIGSALIIKDAPGVEQCQKYQYFVAQICMTAQFKPLLEELQKQQKA